MGNELNKLQHLELKVIKNIIGLTKKMNLNIKELPILIKKRKLKILGNNKLNKEESKVSNRFQAKTNLLLIIPRKHILLIMILKLNHSVVLQMHQDL